MTSTSLGGVRHVAERTERAAGRAGHRVADATRRGKPSVWVERAARFGYAVRGALYIVVGVLAVAVAAGAGGEMTSPGGAIQTIAALPYGRALLALLALGLAGYGLWGFIRAFFDPLRRGDDAGGWAQRIGYLSSGCAYSSLVLPAVQLALGSGGQNHGGAPIPETVLAHPAGRWLVAAVGMIWIAGAGLAQLYQAWTGSFRKDFESWRMNREETELAMAVGRAGLAARGVVFAIMGWFLVQAAWTADAYQTKGIDGALQVLAAQPYGPLLLGVIAAGLTCFGAFSICCAFWVRVRG